MKLIRPSGSNVALIEISGNPKDTEPAEFRVMFPGGHVEITRATDDACPAYWVHLYVNRPEAGGHIPGETQTARIVDARLDQNGKHSSEANLGDFSNPELYHVALRVKRD